MPDWIGVVALMKEFYEKRAEEAIKNAPTVDVVECKIGQWYDVGSLSCRCSECGCKSPKEYLFCPNCGARMDGGKAEYSDGTIHCGTEIE